MEINSLRGIFDTFVEIYILFYGHLVICHEAASYLVFISWKWICLVWALEQSSLNGYYYKKESVKGYYHKKESV